MTDYSDHPPTVGELRSDKTQSAHDWSPRDALIAALRDIDSGNMDPTNLIVACAKIHDDGSIEPYYFIPSRNNLETNGLMISVWEHLFRSRL